MRIFLRAFDGSLCGIWWWAAGSWQRRFNGDQTVNSKHTLYRRYAIQCLMRVNIKSGEIISSIIRWNRSHSSTECVAGINTKHFQLLGIPKLYVSFLFLLPSTECVRRTFPPARHAIRLTCCCWAGFSARNIDLSARCCFIDFYLSQSDHEKNGTKGKCVRIESQNGKKYYSIESLPNSIELVPSASEIEPHIRFFRILYLHVNRFDILMLRWITCWAIGSATRTNFVRRQWPRTVPYCDRRVLSSLIELYGNTVGCDWRYPWCRSCLKWIMSPVIVYVSLK